MGSGGVESWECIATYPYSAGTVKVMDGDMFDVYVYQTKRERSVLYQLIEWWNGYTTEKGLIVIISHSGELKLVVGGYLDWVIVPPRPLSELIEPRTRILKGKVLPWILASKVNRLDNW